MKDLKFIADQLRKPSGDFAPQIAEKMGVGNRPLYELSLESIAFKDEDSILEIGFGSGTHFPELMAKAKNLEVSGIDYSPEMKELATSNNKRFIGSGQLHLYTGNSNSLPFLDDYFDTVFCNMVIYFWETPDEHLKELARVLKPGGMFYTGMRIRQSTLDLPFTKYGFNLYTITMWKEILISNGFKVVKVDRRKDPAFDEFDKLVELESVCITANI